ncbi:MAG: aminotransferase class V-fold PLP-dependent enzyme [Myxococcales bacterium]|nr:aminotransferase class V-fold PLP-dependent enzyme [Myxococcales bacterium]
MDIPNAAQAVLSRLPKGVARRLEVVLDKLPIVGDMVRAEKKKLAESMRESVRKHRPTELKFDALPREGLSQELILETLRTFSTRESPMWREGRVSGGVYHGDEQHLRFLNEVYALYSQANPLHADVWPSVARFEADLVAFTAKLMGGDAHLDDDEEVVCGTLSSGGTESIMLAMKAYRDHAQATRGIKHGNIVAPVSAHPAFDKAAHTMGVEMRRVPVDGDGRANVAAMKAAVDGSTLVMVGSAVSFPHGVIDPIEELSAFARSKGIGFHTDACLGGFILAFAAEAGFPVPKFDFSLPGVTSMSNDTHKFGYAAKGSSVVLYRGRALRRSQYFTTPEWTGGLYVTPGFAGSRPGALIASAWAAMVSLGHDGYVKHTRAVLETAREIRKAIEAIPQLRIIGDPLWVIAFQSDVVDVYRVLDEMAKRGWSLNGLQHPSAVHLCVTLRHTQPGVAQQFAADLRAAVEAVRDTPPAKDGMAPVYGLASSLPFKGMVSDMLCSYVDALYDA